MDRDERFGVLLAWRVVGNGVWPQLFPEMSQRAAHWPGMGPADLEHEIQHFLHLVDDPENPVRLFWKIGPELPFVGANLAFVRDSGFPSREALLGKTDLDRDIAWSRQGAKYRRDDQEVMREGKPRLDIIERQDAASSTTWVRTSKAPIRVANGGSIGVLGMYEVIDAATAMRLQRSAR